MQKIGVRGTHHASDKKGCHQSYNHFDSCRFGFVLFAENMYGNATLIFFLKTVIPMGVFISDDNQGNLR